MVHLYFGINVKYTKSKCFCSENTVKTHENTSKTVHFIKNIWYMCILVYMWNVPKVNVSAVKAQWKHMKTLAKLCISCRIYGTCVFWYTCVMYKKLMFQQWKQSANTSKTMHFMWNIWYMCILVYMWNEPKIHVSAVKTQ
jgi:hypothetical protein